VRQEDPLSPLLFCLAEEVTSRSIILLYLDRKLLMAAGPKQIDFPTQEKKKYAYDVIFFAGVPRKT